MELLKPVFTKLVGRLLVASVVLLLCCMVALYGDQWGIGHSYPLVSPYHRGMLSVSILLCSLTLYYGLPRYLIMALVSINLVWLLGPFVTLGEIKPLYSILLRFLICVAIAMLALGYYLAVIAVQTDGALAQKFSSLPFLPQYVPPRYPQLTRCFKDWRKILRNLKRQVPLSKRLFCHTSANDQQACIVMVGPSQSGKTSALLNAELIWTLPSQQQVAQQPIASTEHSELWLTDNALWCDTPGRYFDPTLATRETADEWHELAKQLVGMKAVAKVDTIILVIDCPRLLSSTARQLTEYAALCRANLRVLQQQTDRPLPFYLFISQVDHLVGFREYFHELSPKERHQLLGEKIEQDPNMPFPRIEIISRQLGSMVDRIEKQVLAKQHQVEDVSIRKGIECFPENIEALTRAIVFFSEQMSPSRTEGIPNSVLALQGIYLGCSELCRESTYTYPQSLIRQWQGQSHGTDPSEVIADKVSVSDKNGETLPRSFRHYFIKTFFHHLIIDDYRLRQSLYQKRFLTRFRRGALFIAILALGAMTVYGMTMSYYTNQRYLADSRQALTRLDQQVRTTQLPLDLALNKLNQLMPTRPVGLESPHFLSGDWGLTMPGQWADEINTVYNQWLIDHLLPRVEKVTLDELSTQLSGGDPQRLFTTLNVYLMLQGELESDSALLETWFASHPVLLSAVESKDNLPPLLRRLFRQTTWQASVDSADWPMINAARQILLQQPLTTFLYQDIVRQLGVVSLPIIDLPQLITSSHPLLFTFQGKVNPSAGRYNLLGVQYWDNQVFTTHFPLAVARVKKILYGNRHANAPAQLPIEQQGLWQQVTLLYLKEYRQYWQDFLNGLQLNLSVTDLGSKQGKQRHRIEYLLKDFTSQDSQLRQLLRNVAQQTQLAPLQQEDERSTLSRSATQAQDFQDRQQKRENVDHYFIALHRFIETPTSHTLLSLDQLELALTQLYITMQATGVTTASQLKTLVSGQGEASGLNAFLLHLNQLPQPLPQLFETLLSVAQQQVTQQTWAVNAQQINQEIIRYCRQHLMGRYPFATSGVEADPRAVAEMFSPQGELTRYFTQYLADKVDTRHRPWRFVTADQTISPRLLTLFEQGEKIQQQLFPQSSQQLGFELTLAVKDLANGITQLMIDNDDQQFRYVHGPILQQKIRWPALSQSPSFQIRAVAAEGRPLWNIEENGYWGLFRWLERSKKQFVSRSRQTVITLGEGSEQALLAVDGLGTSVPHLIRLFRQFDCSITE